MQTRCYFLCLAFAWITACAYGKDRPSLLVPVPTPTPNEEEELTVIRNLWRPKMIDAFNLLPEPKRSRFAELLRNYNPSLAYEEIRHSDQIEQYHIPWDILIALGDPVTGAYLSKALLRNSENPFASGWDLLTEWRSAQFIKELGPALETDEPIWQKGSAGFDVGPGLVETFSVALAETTLRNFHDSFRYSNEFLSAAPYYPEFSPGTKASMKEFYREWNEARKEMLKKAQSDPNYSYDDAMTESYSAVRKTMKAWWIANKESFLAEKYDEVKPLDEATTIPPPKTARSQRNNTIPLPSVPTPGVIPSSPEPTQKPSVNYVVLATTSAILAVLIVFFGYRLTRNKPRAP